MGENLFQFKFKTEFDMERTIHDGPWTFDNQLLLVQKWHRGMTAKNVNLDLASLWIKIWDAPFDMVSPTVAKEVGGRLGKVEEAERRRNPDDQNIFMRVKVVLPISKPLRRGAYLASANGERTWCNFKYERLPLFCHYCMEHFAAAKQNEDVKCQYGDWLRASGGRSRTPPKRCTKDIPNSTRDGEEAHGDGGGNSKSAELKPAAVKLDKNPRVEGGYGSCGKTGTILEGHQYSPMILGDVVTSMERGNRFNEGTVRYRGSKFKLQSRSWANLH